jgi:peptide/nickel transport system substrate-binding protein
LAPLYERASARAVRLVLLSCALAAGALAACAQPPAPASAPVTLRVGVAAPVSDPGSGLSNTADSLVYESFLGIGWDGKPTPRLATEWEWIKRGLELKLTLHPSIKFHDGTVLDASLAREVLLDGIKRVRPGNHVSLKSITGVDVVDEQTLVVRLRAPEAFLPTDIAILALSHPLNRSIGTGPYKKEPQIAAGNKDTPASTDLVRLSAFGDYYRGKPMIDLVELRRYDEHRSAWAELLRGNADMVYEVTPAVLDFVEAQSTVKTFSFTRPYYFQMLFNMRHPALKHPSVRQAMSQAVDREALVNGVFKGRAVPADGPIWPMHWAYSSAGKTLTFNPEAATLRLDAGGFKLVRREGAMPSRFQFTCVTLANDARYERIASLLQKQFEAVGIDMRVEAVPYLALADRIGKGQFDALLLERASARSLAWVYLTFHSSMTPSGYSAADKVLDRLRRATTDEETRLGVSDLQTILHDDPPGLFLMWPTVSRAVNTNFAVNAEEGRDVFNTLWQWRKAPTP